MICRLEPTHMACSNRLYCRVAHLRFDPGNPARMRAVADWPRHGWQHEQWRNSYAPLLARSKRNPQLAWLRSLSVPASATPAPSRSSAAGKGRH
jgi:hypothetical protein